MVSRSRPLSVGSGDVSGLERNGDSLLTLESRVYAGERFVDFRLAVNWREARKVLTWVFPQHHAEDTRFDGVMGGFVARANDGKGLPLRDWTIIRGSTDASNLGFVCPDVFASDCTTENLRLTLLRAPYMAHHDPLIAGTRPRGVIAHQGVHTFRFRVYRGPNITPDRLESHARQLNRPPLVADLTRGMPTGV